MTPLPVDTSSPAMEMGTYAELKHLITEQGLLKKSPSQYLLRVLIVQVLFVGSVAMLVLVPLFWLQCLNALFLAFITTQMGFIGHDAGHRQIFNSTSKNNAVGLFMGNIQMGMSFSWWLGKHNAHHARPNEIESDPDIAVPLIAFTSQDALMRRGVGRFIAKHQAWYFFPILLFVSIDLQVSSIKYLLSKQAKQPRREALLLVAHYAWYMGLIFAILPLWQGIVFIIIHQAASGLYLGSVFAPNHKGMLITEHDSQMDFLHRQVLTARNVRANPIIDYWYGGLNYQIEHHLFPSMPRRHLAQAQRIIRHFCQQHAIAYHETSVARSYREIVAYLYEVGAPLRTQIVAA
jgi:fatty acid desaturase